ncbi:MAG: archease [Thioalkalivibrio sp.]|nr:MAG: archease [Thioalkalivibrio sp.]
MQAHPRESPETSIPTPIQRWEHYPHEADMGVRGYGATLGEAFAAAATAMTAIVTDPAEIEPVQHFTFDCPGPDPELLLYDFLNALVYEMAVEGRLFGRFRVGVDDGNLSAEAWGEPVDRLRHQPAVEIKGATFTQLAVWQTEEGQWVAQCVLDI